MRHDSRHPCGRTLHASGTHNLKDLLNAAADVPSWSMQIPRSKHAYLSRFLNVNCRTKNPSHSGNRNITLPSSPGAHVTHQAISDLYHSFRLPETRLLIFQIPKHLNKGFPQGRNNSLLYNDPRLRSLLMRPLCRPFLTPWYPQTPLILLFSLKGKW